MFYLGVFMKLAQFPLSLISVLLVLLPSCKNDEQDVSVKVHRMSLTETKALFRGRGRQLTKGSDAIVPLRVIVENNMEHAITVKPATMAITDSQVLYCKVKKNVAAITAGATLGGLLLTPFVAAALGAGFGISSTKKNEAILNEVTQDAFIESNEVYPKSTLNKIMFVRKNNFQPVFTIPVGSRMFKVNLA